MNDKTHFHERTPDDVQRVLEKARVQRWIVRLVQGDTETGRAWMEENDVVGFIGRSTGSMKVPLLIEPLLRHKGSAEITMADGGPALLDHCLLRIINVVTGEELYRHPKYTCPLMNVGPSVGPAAAEGYEAAAFLWDPQKGKWELQANFKPQNGQSAEEQAYEYIAFVQGHKTHRAFRTLALYREEQERYEREMEEEEGN